MKTLIVIPAYNTQNSLLDVLLGLQDKCSNDILVVDDGSDKALYVNNEVKNNVVLVANDKNRGKGYSLKKAIKYAQDNKYTHMVTIDSDMQHNPDFIGKFIKSNSEFDIVFGKRSFKSPMPFHRMLSNKITSMIISFLIKNKIEDSQCGYRKYKLSIFENIELLENGYQFESEVLLKCLNSKSLISNINIETLYPENNKSYMNNSKDTYKFVKLIIRQIFA